MNVIDWLAKQEQYNPDKRAILDIGANRAYTYREFNAEAEKVRSALQEFGVKPGDRVCALLPNGAEILFALFGATKLGAIFVPLNLKLSASEQAEIMADAGPKVLIDHEGLHGVGPAGEGSGAVDMESPQMLLYTSGTTGKPKGAILSHRHILWNAINTSHRLLTASDTVLIHSPMFYTGGLNVFTLPAFYLGATVAILKTFHADEVLEQVERLRITCMFAVPTQLGMMADSPRFGTVDLSSLRYVISGGAPCPVDLIERWIERGVTMRQGFGLTEAGPNCFALDARDAVRKAGSIGFPNFTVEARIEDGELLLKTPAMCSGYWNNPEQTAAAIREGWFHTGDIATVDSEGYWYIVDRKKDMFISGGENVYPAEVERVLLSHPKVAEAAVFGTPHLKWGEVGMAAVVLKDGEALTGQELLSFCVGKIAKFKIPKSVIWVNELPRTASGKVRKQDLKRQLG